MYRGEIIIKLKKPKTGHGPSWKVKGIPLIRESWAVMAAWEQEAVVRGSLGGGCPVKGLYEEKLTMPGFGRKKHSRKEEECQGLRISLNLVCCSNGGKEAQ